MSKWVPRCRLGSGLSEGETIKMDEIQSTESSSRASEPGRQQVEVTPGDVRHRDIPCNEFLCLPEVHPGHYTADPAPAAPTTILSREQRDELRRSIRHLSAPVEVMPGTMAILLDMADRLEAAEAQAATRACARDRLKDELGTITTQLNEVANERNALRKTRCLQPTATACAKEWETDHQGRALDERGLREEFGHGGCDAIGYVADALVWARKERDAALDRVTAMEANLVGAEEMLQLALQTKIEASIEAYRECARIAGDQENTPETRAIRNAIAARLRELESQSGAQLPSQPCPRCDGTILWEKCAVSGCQKPSMTDASRLRELEGEQPKSENVWFPKGQTE